MFGFVVKKAQTNLLGLKEQSLIEVTCWEPFCSFLLNKADMILMYFGT